MLNDKKHIDSIFHDELYNYGEDLPSYTWNNIDDILAGNKKKKSLVLYYGIAASVAILIAFYSGYTLKFAQNYTPEVATIQQKKKAVFETEIKTPILITYNENNSSVTTKKQTKTTTAVSQTTNTISSETNQSLQVLPIAEIIPVSFPSDSAQRPEDTKDTALPIEIIQTDLLTNITDNNTANDLPDNTELLAINTPTTTPSKWSIGSQYSPGGISGKQKENVNAESYLDETINNNPQNYSSTKESLETQNDIVIVYSTGLSIKYQQKKWNLRTGLYYSLIKESINYSEIPIIAGYTLAKKRISVEPIAGLGAGILFSGQTRINDPIVFSLITGLDFSIDITKHLSLVASPVLKYYVPVNNNIISRLKPFQPGIYTGINYSF